MPGIMDQHYPPYIVLTLLSREQNTTLPYSGGANIHGQQSDGSELCSSQLYEYWCSAAAFPDLEGYAPCSCSVRSDDFVT